MVVPDMYLRRIAALPREEKEEKPKAVRARK
jgi:hypothetical protein